MSKLERYLCDWCRCELRLTQDGKLGEDSFGLNINWEVWTPASSAVKHLCLHCMKGVRKMVAQTIFYD